MNRFSAILAVLSIFLSPSTYSQSVNLYFGYDMYRLTEEHQTIVKNFMDSIQCDSFHVSVIGHTDNHASDEYNIALSARRTASAIAQLKVLGIPSEKIIEVKKGELQPVATNETDQGRARNRRVEINVSNCDDIYGSLEEIAKRISLPGSETHISGVQSQIITLPKGTILDIPDSAFANKEGRLVDDVTLYTTEVYSIGDMIRAGVVTQTDDLSILKSGGMLNIIAVGNGDTLEIVKPILVAMNTDSSLVDYKVFRGSSNPQAQNAITWHGERELAPFDMNLPSPACCNLSCVISERRSFWNKVGNFFGTDSWGTHTYTNSTTRRDNREIFDLCTTLIRNRSKYSKLTTREYLDSAYAEGYARFGVNSFEEYYAALANFKRDSIAQRIASEGGSLSAVSTLMRITSGGWYNLDQYYKIPQANQVTLFVNGFPLHKTLIRCIVPKDNVCVVPILENNQTGKVFPLQRGSNVIIFACQIKNGETYMALHNLENLDNSRVTLNFKQVTGEELIESMNRLDLVNTMTQN